MGLREDKKAQTRLHISNVATELFLEHGFANVTVAEVAQAAGISKMTVFNYFDTKEDLLLDRQPDDVAALCAAVSDRQAGESVTEALRRLCLTSLNGRCLAIVNSDRALKFWLEVRANQDLHNRALQQRMELQDELAATLADAIPGQWRAQAAARLIVATLETVFTTMIDRHLTGTPGDENLAAGVATVNDAFDLLANGLGEYGARP
jgi:AcrR family transcriptional regulator